MAWFATHNTLGYLRLDCGQAACGSVGYPELLNPTHMVKIQHGRIGLAAVYARMTGFIVMDVRIGSGSPT